MELKCPSEGTLKSRAYPFNRTAYGIEIYYIKRNIASTIYLLIALL